VIAKRERAQAAGKTGGISRPKRADSSGDAPAPKLSRKRQRPAMAKAARISERKLRRMSRLAKAAPAAVARIAQGKTTIRMSPEEREDMCVLLQNMEAFRASLFP
jgi:hypothetical protein